MFSIAFEKLLPIFLFFGIGYALQAFKLLKRDDALVLIKLVFYLMSPAVIILSVSQMKFSPTLIYYPISAICIHICMFTIGKIIMHFKKLPPSEEKIFRGATLIMNMTFILPFFIVFFGEKNVYMLSIFDAGNLMIITTVVYSIFVSDEKTSMVERIKTVFKSPLVIALVIGIVLNISGVTLPKGIEHTIREIAQVTGTLIMIGLGMYFTPRFSNLKLSLTIIFVKVVGILIVGTIIGNILPLDPMGKTMIILGALSPVGNNVLTFTLIGKGDLELATNVVSLSIIISFINLSIYFLTSTALHI
ncbi:AEC family transporter [Fusobacterium sp.]|uniref:AEC family transporter n=1 Tax=Fusobacterium sp. TaxID=68766 RepID=UPI00396C51A4